MPIPCDVRDVMLRTNDRLYCFLCKVARLPKHGHTRDVIIYDNKEHYNTWLKAYDEL